ncbi:MAG: ABC transporter permease [Leptospiraceae bacterium]|nr:ABC transporter permease [Leptospiraceae bacterium]MCP5495254.1 ABC transporter permease [Leptospiraceae bacterium]
MFQYIKHLNNFFIDIFRNRSIIYSLTKRDLISRYLGSYFGILWAFIQPITTIILLWLVFTFGFRSTPIDDFPFILWLIAGLIPYNFISECMTGAANSILQNSFLVKKIVFRVSLLPIVKILSASVIHLFFILVLIFMFGFYNKPPDLYSIQLIYYYFAALFFLLGLSWITSSIVIFFRDLGQIISVLVQLLFWATPIVWSPKYIPEKYLPILYLNPVFYITEGYRNSLIYKVWFWEEPYKTLYYWGVASVIFVIGAIIFRRLRPHFADVL